MSGTHRKLHSNRIDQKQPRSQEVGNGGNSLLSWNATGYQKPIPGLFQVIATATGGISSFLVFIVIVAWHLRFTTLPQIALDFSALRTAFVLQGRLFFLAIALMVLLARIADQHVVRLGLIEASHRAEPISDRLWMQGQLCESCHFLHQLTEATPQILYFSARAINDEALSKN